MGSGQHCRSGAKSTTDDYRSIDVRPWKRDGLLDPNQSFNWQWSRNGEVVASIQVKTEQNHLILTYRHRYSCEDWKSKSYPVYFDWTDCHLGGQRPWFLCPARGCSRRVAVLYLETIFACRNCYQLAYDSQRETWDERAARKADRIRKKLDWEPGILNSNGWKPKGMHWKTFERLNAKHSALADISLAGIVQRFNLKL